MFPVLAVFFMAQGMYRAFNPRNKKPEPKLVRTWSDELPEAPLSAFAKSLESI
jgi:hypothetical protein